MAALSNLTILLLICLLSVCLGAKPSCKVCKDLVKSFNKRLDETAKSNFAGGDTNWEEEKLGSYANSEVRLIEMLDNVCRHSDYDCHRLLENYEEDIERWWFKLRHKDGNGDLQEWLCTANLDVCCPPGTFGASCSDCPGGRDNVCGGHGTCKGSEEKDGEGVCQCDGGYTGITCQSCDTSYYNDTESGECKRCDKACEDACSGPGADSCKECADGYRDDEDGCTDVDECAEDESLCKDGTYCLNTPGKYRCQACDKSCTVCNGPGSMKCGDCATGYERNERGACEDVNECETEDLCSSGSYCENSQGSYTCKACHVSCHFTCSGPGADGCDECKQGYRMVDDACQDIDECSNTPGPCDEETEMCVNLAGSFACKCKDGLVKSADGECVKPAKKTKKKKKKGKKGKKTAARQGEGVEVATETEKPAESNNPEPNIEEPVREDQVVEAAPTDQASDDTAPNQTDRDSDVHHHGNEEIPDIVSSDHDEL